MFKLESYITPILLSYFDKYIKNFKLENSQVSLWGGDASFHNLDLRLEVLEQELQSPFSFISGHIRELLIHVPWTKLTSEPIVVTINTIECVLKLRNAESSSENLATPQKSGTRPARNKVSHKHQEVEAPPNYVQLLINKIVNNIRIFCNNVILKYVEEDIVLSMNIKHLKLESCNEKWETAYVDVSPTQVIQRKMIGVSDLTICLDKRNTSGKIDVYQEPMLYRCSMNIHVLRVYHSATANKNSLTRIDVHCNNMEFSITEQQVPMFARLLLLLYSLQQKHLKSKNESQDNLGSSAETKETAESSETWTGWAWSYFSAVLPTLDEPWDKEETVLDQTGHIVHFGAYVDQASLTFKLSESTSDKGYYSQKKIRYAPLLTLQLQGIYSEFYMVGAKWLNSCSGISEVLLLPVGFCSCAHNELEESQFQPYLRIGSKSLTHKVDSLFNPEMAENKGLYKHYNTNWDFHVLTKPESVLLERTPAFVCDYVYQMEIPDDVSSEVLSDLASNLEFSNLAERSMLRICCSPIRFRICSGLFHRIGTLQVAASSYDYSPYYVPKTELSFHELLPPSSEDFDALNEFIPNKSIKITAYDPMVEVQCMDHPFFIPTKGNLFRKHRKHSTSIAQSLHFEKIPKLTIECKVIEASFSFPMYANRLVHTTCQLPEPPKKMFDACFSKQDISVIGLCCRLVLKSNNITTIIVPFSLSYHNKSILKPHCWTHPDTLHTEIRFESENLTFNGTKAKLMVMSELIDKVVRRDTEDLSILINTSLLFDAAKDQGMPYLEFYMEGVKFKKITTNSTVSFDILLGSIKAFIFESLDSSKNNIQQVLFLSGPEPKDSKPRSGKSALEELPLFTATMQYPTKPELQAHPPLLIFNLQEIKICVDPLLCKWFLYQPIDILLPKHQDGSDRSYFPSRNFSETLGSTSETPRRTHIESVHSSSDREFMSKSLNKLPKISEEESVDLQENINIFLKTWSVVWKGMIFNGYIHQGTIYFPMASISAIGSQGIEQAIKESANKGSSVMVITLPFAKIQSAQKQNVLEYLKTLPVKLPDNVWSLDKPSFPWTMSIADLQCYTIQSGKKSSFLKPTSLNATVGLSTKSALSETSTSDKAPLDASGNKTMGQLGVYIHIDMTPIVISTSESQICLLASILYGLAEVCDNLFPKKITEVNLSTETLPPIIVGASTSLSPTALDDTSDNTMPTEDLESEKETNENVKFTAWIQWTITRFSFELLTNDSVKKETEKAQLKLFIDVEDIVTSLDYQSVYLKLKCKIGSVGIQHFKRKSEKSEWQPGPFSGVIMRLREDVRVEKYEENGFISVTITRASCQHTHNLWGTVQKTKQEKPKSSMPSTSRYITEIVVNVQPIDFVIPLKTLMNFYVIMTPLLDVSTAEEQRHHHEIEPKPVKKSSWFNNQSLPLAYLECKDIRVIIPSAELAGTGHVHNVFVLQLNKINLSPSVANPICRAPVRPDIYKQAVQSRILNIPGSDLEDRQYQLDIIGTSISTAAWDDLDHVLNIGGSHSAKGVSENPALEWNNLKQGQLSIVPILNLKQVSERFDVCIVAAPTMLYKSDILICGNSFEINIVTDIDIYISLSQLKLASTLANEFFCSSELSNGDDYEIRRPKVTFPYSRFEKYAHLNDTVENELTEFYKDSGIDTSEIISVLSSKSLAQKNASFSSQRKVSKSATSQVSQQATSEVLLTAGKISVSFFETLLNQTFQGKKGNKWKRKNTVKFQHEDLNYEASEEESVDESNKNHQNYIPLIFFCISQPNIYVSNRLPVSRSQVSCFDISVKMNCAESSPIATVPTVQDYSVELIETRSGNPDPGTGIPPAFFTLKYAKEQNNPLNLSIDISRPTKLAVSTSKLSCLMTLGNKIAGNFTVRTPPLHKDTEEEKSGPAESVTKFRQMKDKLKDIDTLRLQTDQIVLLLESESGTEMNLTIGRLKNRLVLSERPEKIHNITKIDCATFCVKNETIERLLLHPWSVSLEFNAFLEPWQNTNSDPQMHITIESDCVILQVSPEQIRLVESVGKEICEFVSSLPFGSAVSESNVTGSDSVEVQPFLQDRDQHYKDDLRAGAFQFIDGNTSNIEELPLPYQVMFWNIEGFSAMAWRYPQPRALIKVRVFPVPFDIQNDFAGSLEVSCNLQYWSEYHGCYLSYAQFSLSESEVCYLDLPKSEPQRAVACIWRVILSSSNEDGRVSVSSRALVACMRIDSYFNKALVPNFTCAASVSKFELSLHSNFNNLSSAVLPENLKHYTSDLAFPETNCFMKVILENFRVHVASWNLEMLLVDINCVMRCAVLDYMFLAERILCEQFTAKAEINFAKELTASLITNEIQLLFGPSIAHTLAVNAQIWNQSQQDQPDFIVFTRYVICNDTNINVRFGQTATDEDILLPSRCFHLYCWRSQRHKRKLRIALEEESWIWSKPFRIDTDVTQTVQITAEHNMSIIIIVKSLSTTQKQIIITGQFLIANMLSEQFDFRIVHSEKDEAKKSPVHILGGKSVTPSMLLNSKTDYFLCLRFFGLESAWTGCIPLKEHTKGAQPWLVKVALQEKGQFLSIWCRIVVQDLQKGKRILAMLWPLFTVKSNLPLTSNIHIETPSLNIHLDSVVSGKGEIQQLYCPGTTDHSHQLTFKLEDGTSISSYIPLNYSLVNQQEFFKKNGKENIETILSSLKEYETSKWPYLPDDLQNINWIVDDQPQTAVQVRYRNACQYSSALMVELLPWCLMVNTFGCPLSLMTNGTELCRIPQNGIVTPPKLDEIFHLGIDTGMGWCYSGALQLAKSDWSQTFYMPKISGTLPLEGNINVAVRCGFHICMVSLSSILHDEIRLLKLSSTHVFSNHLNTQIQVICFAVPEGDQIFDFPTNLGQYSFTVAPHSKMNDSGVSIIQWYLIDQNFDPSNEIALYVSFLFEYPSGWSCPINVDKKFKRKSFYVKSGKKSVPLVLTSQEYKGQIYISLYHDDHPQTLIENNSTVSLYCAQSVSETAVAPECRHFKWTSRLDSGSSVYYTMPFVSEKFPELPQTCFSEKIVFSRKTSDDLQWSTPVSITSDLEQFVRIPMYGDIKLMVKVTAYATLIMIKPVSQVEINAIDIRGRLSMHELYASSPVDGQKNATSTIDAEKSSLSVFKTSSDVIFYDSVFTPTIPLKKDVTSVHVLTFIKSFSIVFLLDKEYESEEQEVARFTMDYIAADVKQTKYFDLKLIVSDIQFDNLLYSKESYDFPVVLVNQDIKFRRSMNIFNATAKRLLETASNDALVVVDLRMETWQDSVKNALVTGVRDVRVTINPISCYIEDLYIFRLTEYFTSISPLQLITWPERKVVPISTTNPIFVKVPDLIVWQSSLVANPLNLRHFVVEPLYILLSVHSSMKMYIALDQSPLQFGRFERRRLLTTPYRLGHAMTMHYLSGAIFGAGWVVSSLELLGSPSGLARAMSTGLRDFVSLPYRGLVQGPWAFLIGVTHGSASLMRHLTAGTLQSVTKLASSVARNLDRLTMDEEHLKRTEEQRRRKPQGVTQGFMQGLTGLGISLLGAVGGIAHHPLQSLMAEGASPRSLAAGVGLGLVGVITKPLSGAAELVALTGQGLLQGAGWNPLPQPRTCHISSKAHFGVNSALKYQWKLLRAITNKNILFVTDATVLKNSVCNAVALILTADALMIVDTDEDAMKRIISLSQLQTVRSEDPTLLVFKIVTPMAPVLPKVEDDGTFEMDPACRARVADYVRSTASLLQLSDDRSSDMGSVPIQVPDLTGESNEQLSFYVNPLIRNYFNCLVSLAKQHYHNNYNFSVI